MTIFFNPGFLLVPIIAFFIIPTATFANDDHAIAPKDELLEMYFTEEELVETATRAPKPITQVAENVTIISAEQIAAMNAHTVNDVLNQVAGLFVDPIYLDFGPKVNLHPQGLEEEHILLLVDGIKLNTLSGNNIISHDIPVQIIRRIEIIKGPATAVWGSSLGGVINIITRSTHTKDVTSGLISGMYGEGDSQDFRTEINTSSGPLGYYLYAGRQKTDGVGLDRFMENEVFYGKVNLDLSADTRIGATLGDTDPSNSYGKLYSADIDVVDHDERTFATTYFDTAITHNLNLHLAGQYMKADYHSGYTYLGLNPPTSAGELQFANRWQEELQAGEMQLVWNTDLQTMVFGAEISRGQLDFTENYGPYWQTFGYPAEAKSIALEEKRGVFINDTVKLDSLTIIGGLRYDYHSISDEFISPSLGLTWNLGGHTLFRLAGARGFTYPPLSFIGGGGRFSVPNPNLDPERIWSVQAGVETAIFKVFNLKTSLFHHKVDQKWEFDNNNLMTVNTETDQRDGFEIGLETASFHNLVLNLDFAYYYARYAGSDDNDESYKTIIKLNYDDNRLLRAQLFGNYHWFTDEQTNEPHETSNIVWDFTFGITPYRGEDLALELFGSVHNIFNSAYYWDYEYPDAGRWVEAGLKVHF